MVQFIQQELAPCLTKIETKPLPQSSLEITASCRFPDSFSGFQGHFPGQPVLPAIMQLATVRHLTETIVKHPLALVQYRRAKFKAMVAPQEELFISVQLKPGDKKISGKFKITTSKNRQVAGGNFIFAKQP